MRILSSLLTGALLSLTSLPAEVLVKNGETVAFLGDSITQAGARTPGGYVNLVASGLKANGIRIKTIPAGISGQKSNQMLDRIGGLLAKKPDWLTLSCGVNDVWHGAKGVPLEDYKKNLTAIVDQCQAAGVKVMILTSTQIRLPTPNNFNTKLIGYNDFLRALAKERKLPVADLNADMLATQMADEAAGLDRSLTTDGVHMNIYGNLMMAKGVLRAFGLDQAQIAKCDQTWLDVPGTCQATVHLNFTLRELAKLDALARTQKESTNGLIARTAQQAIDDSIKSFSD